MPWQGCTNLNVEFVVAQVEGGVDGLEGLEIDCDLKRLRPARHLLVGACKLYVSHVQLCCTLLGRASHNSSRASHNASGRASH
jgi:hypothetical protein